MSWQPPVIRTAILSVLDAAAAGRFTVEGFQRQSHAAEELTLRHVTVFYRQGQFDKSRSGWVQGPFRHNMTFSVELALAAPARMDLTIINDDTATPQTRMSALAASIEAAANADALWDELAGIIWDILIDPRNLSLGLPISDRWIPSIRKENPAPRGEFVLLTGSMDYTCEGVETPSGETGIAGAGIDLTQDQTADITGSAIDSAEQGAKVGT